MRTLRLLAMLAGVDENAWDQISNQCTNSSTFLPQARGGFSVLKGVLEILMIPASSPKKPEDLGGFAKKRKKRNDRFFTSIARFSAVFGFVVGFFVLFFAILAASNSYSNEETYQAFWAIGFGLGMVSSSVVLGVLVEISGTLSALLDGGGN